MRSRFVDIAKGLGLALVFIGHGVEVVPTPSAWAVFRWIYAFHMPLFFVLSGVVLAPSLKRRAPVKPFLQQIFRRLLIPYWAVGSLCLFLWIAQTAGIRQFQHAAGLQWIGGQWLQLLLGRPQPSVVIWFLYATAAVRVALWVATPLLQRFGLPAVSLAVAALWAVLGHGRVEPTTFATQYLSPFSILGFVLFTLVGAALREAVLQFRPRWSTAGALAVATLAFTPKIVPVLGAGRFGDPLQALVAAFFGSALLIALASRLENFRVANPLADMGQRSLGIFCLNGFMLAFLNRPLGTELAVALGKEPAAYAMIAIAIVQLVAAWTLVEIYDETLARFRNRKAQGEVIHHRVPHPFVPQNAVVAEARGAQEG